MTNDERKALLTRYIEAAIAGEWSPGPDFSVDRADVLGDGTALYIYGNIPSSRKGSFMAVRYFTYDQIIHDPDLHRAVVADDVFSSAPPASELFGLTIYKQRHNGGIDAALEWIGGELDRMDKEVT